MWSFLSAIFNKAASLVTSVIVALGLVSSPITITPSSELQANVSEVLSEVLENKESLAPAVKKVEQKPVPATVPLPPPKTTIPVPAPVSLPVLSAPAPAAPSVPAGTFRLPNGSLVDANGNIIQPATQSVSSSQTVSQQTVQAPTEIDYSQYANPPSGAALQILKSIAVPIEFNPLLTCEELGFTPKQRNGYLCKLFKTQKNNYNWDIVESYTQDLSQYKQSSASTASSSSQPASGSVVSIPRSVVIPIGFNDNLPCQDLGFSGENLNLCKLYKEHKNEYTWNITD